MWGKKYVRGAKDKTNLVVRALKHNFILIFTSACVHLTLRENTVDDTLGLEHLFTVFLVTPDVGEGLYEKKSGNNILRGFQRWREEGISNFLLLFYVLHCFNESRGIPDGILPALCSLIRRSRDAVEDNGRHALTVVCVMTEIRKRRV